MMEHLDPELLSAYIDNELPAADVAAVERHLAACDACRAEYEELRALSTLVRELPVYQPKRAIDVSEHPRGGSDTLAKIVAFSKPLAIAAVVLLVAFAGLRLLTNDEPDDAGDQISFSAVQPTDTGTEIEREASEEQAVDAPAAAPSGDETAEEPPPPDAAFQEAPADAAFEEAPADAAFDQEVADETIPPPLGALPVGQVPSQATSEVVAGEPGTAEPQATVAATPAPEAEPEPEQGADGDSWLPVAIVVTIIVALAGVAGWYRFVRLPRRRGP